MGLTFYHLDSEKNFSAPELAQPAALKKAGLKLELLTHFDILYY